MIDEHIVKMLNIMISIFIITFIQKKENQNINHGDKKER